MKKLMKIELTEEERNYLLEVCKRAKMFADMRLPDMPHIIAITDLEKIKVLINKLSEKNE